MLDRFAGYTRIIALLALILSHVVPSLAYAQLAPLQLASLFITEQVEMDFAILAVPQVGSESITIPANGGAESGSGTVLFGSVARGEYDIGQIGISFQTISIDITGITSGSPHVTLDQFEGIYDNSITINSFPRGGLTNPHVLGLGARPLYLGATVTYTSNVGVGSVSPSFDIEVVFE